jgi:membrane protease YdiL (CAAX protease family)
MAPLDAPAAPTSPPPGVPWTVAGERPTRWTRRPRWGCGDIAIGIGLLVVSSFLFGIPIVVAGIPEDSLGYEAISAMSVWVPLGGWALYCSWVKGLARLKLDFAWAFRWFDPVIGIGLAFATILIGAGLDAVQQAFGVTASSNTGFLVEAAGNTSILTYVGFVLIVALGAPIFEELFFRGLTFSALEKRYNGIIAVVGSSVIFGLLHFQPGDVVPTIFFLVNITIFGLILGISRYVTKRTGPGVFAHMAFNLTTAIVILATTTR